MGLRNKKPRQLNYSVNVKGPKSGWKIESSIKHFKKLQERIAFEGKTKWLKNAVNIVSLKLKRYSVNINKI